MKNFENKSTLKTLKAQAYEALRGDDEKKQEDAFSALFEGIAEEAKVAAETKTSELYSAVNDEKILTARGTHRPMTSIERKHFAEAVEKQKLEGLDSQFPKTIIQDIFKDLEENHPVISLVDTQYTGAVLEYVWGVPGKNAAFWGNITEDIRQIILGAFKRLDMQVSKLSGFVALPKSYFQLGPAWLGNYVRIVLRESIEIALEDAIINGDGFQKPIGLVRKLNGAVDGVYPKKPETPITDFSPFKLAGIRATMADKKTDKGEVVWLVNPATYWAKFYPNLAYQTPTGAWVTTSLPTGERIIQSHAVPKDTAIVGVMKNYILAVAGTTEIKAYDQTLAIEDMDLYIAKMFGTGIAKDPNAFFVLDVSGISGATPVDAEADAALIRQDNINPVVETTPEP